MTKSERIAILEEKIINLEGQFEWQKELINWLMTKHQDLIIRPYQPNIVQPIQPYYENPVWSDPHSTIKPTWIASETQIISSSALEV